MSPYGQNRLLRRVIRIVKVTEKSAICDSCGLGKKSRMKPHREEKSVRFLSTSHGLSIVVMLGLACIP